MDCVGAEIKLCLTMWHVVPRFEALHILMSILDFVSSYNQMWLSIYVVNNARIVLFVYLIKPNDMEKRAFE